jgi:hypothetical protein
MTYRFPVVEGDRVALAPHLDLFMAGVRFGTVTGVEHTGPYGAAVYTVWCNQRTVIRAMADDLLGAVNPLPGRSEGGPGLCDRHDGMHARLADDGENTCRGWHALTGHESW